MIEDELTYWKTLAIERGRALDELRARLRAALAVVPDAQVADLAAALDGRITGWTQEPDRMEPLAELRAADVPAILDDLWNRVAADGAD